MSLYYSLVSSLPFLRMTDKPALSYEKFMESCGQFIHGREFQQLKQFSLIPGFRPEDADSGEHTAPAELLKQFKRGSLAERYTHFEIALRHSMMKLRASRLGKNFVTANPDEIVSDSEADQVIHAAFAAPNPLERERILDIARWLKLDELEAKNTTRFNLDTVCAYSIRIQIAEKWVLRQAGPAERNLSAVAAQVSNGTSEV